MNTPTREQGHAAHLQGQEDALAGLDRDEACPFDRKSPDSVTRCLYAAYQRGYGYGRQVRLQRTYGPIPGA